MFNSTAALASMFVSILLLLLNFYVVSKRGISFACLFVFSIYGYFYPILFLNEIKFIADGLYVLPLATGARISLWLGILWMILIAWFFSPHVQRDALEHEAKESINSRYLGILFALIVFATMLLVIAKHGLGLQGRSKADFMSGIGYDYKLFLISGLVLLIYSWLRKGLFLRILAFSVVVFDLSYGFRGMLASSIVLYFLVSNENNFKKIFYRFGLGFLFFVALVVFKVSSYGALGLEELASRLNVVSFSDFLDLIVLANSESSTISAVFNEVVRQDYSISFSYLLGAFFSPIPLAGAFGAPIVEFSEFYKSVVFGEEGSSFASGFLAVGYAIGGYGGVALIFIFYSFVAILVNRYINSENIVFRIMVLVLAIMSLITFPRSDFVYSFGALRSYLLFVLVLYVVVAVLRTISKGYLSKRTD